jgi:hypothetical protein
MVYVKQGHLRRETTILVICRHEVVCERFALLHIVLRPCPSIDQSEVVLRHMTYILVPPVKLGGSPEWKYQHFNDAIFFLNLRIKTEV